MQKRQLIALLISVQCINNLAVAKPATPCKKETCHKSVHQETALKEAMRKLWADHVFWTRDFIVAAIAGAKNTAAVQDRLMKNQDDIGNAIAGYYGQDAGKKLTNLLKEHIVIAAEVVMAAKAKNKAKVADADTRWHKNARDIAKFLSDANPYWGYDDMESMLYEHLKLTTHEAVDHINKKWAQDIKDFDAVFTEILKMADSLSNGIIKQFPEKF